MKIVMALVQMYAELTRFFFLFCIFYSRREFNPYIHTRDSALLKQMSRLGFY